MNLTKTEQEFYDLLRHLIYMSGSEKIKISYNHIGQLLRCQPGTAYRNIQRLKAKGVIKIRRPDGRENEYRLIDGNI